MKCCVIGCQNKAKWLRIDELCQVHKDKFKSQLHCYLDDDEVVVSEYEAYKAWEYMLSDKELYELIVIVQYGSYERDEIESALFGWWNEHVRGKK